MKATLIGVICGIAGIVLAAAYGNWYAAAGWAGSAAWASIVLLQDKHISMLKDIVTHYEPNFWNSTGQPK